jgi:hypothetical protein
MPLDTPASIPRHVIVMDAWAEFAWQGCVRGRIKDERPLVPRVPAIHPQPSAIPPVPVPKGVIQNS